MALIHLPLLLPFIHAAAAWTNRSWADLPSKTQTDSAGELTSGWRGSQRLWLGLVSVGKNPEQQPRGAQPSSCVEQPEAGRAWPWPWAAQLGKHQWKHTGMQTHQWKHTDGNTLGCKHTDGNTLGCEHTDGNAPKTGPDRPQRAQGLAHTRGSSPAARPARSRLRGLLAN